MTAGVVPISYTQLAIASLLLLAAIIISLKLELGQAKNILISSIRTVIQLSALGFVLEFIFEVQTWWLILLIVIFMLVSATQIATNRVKNHASGIRLSIFISLAISSMIVALLVITLVVKADPWYSARQFIPIVSIVLGNAMSSTAVAIDRLFNDMKLKKDEMETIVALGGSPAEAATPSIKRAISAGMVPILASMSAAGIVTIPGTMTGQLLAGADPVAASKYQIVIMFMLSAANAISVFLACYLSYKKSFSGFDYYLDK
ncbi:MAG: iron export ABC transporter permease subunit FetB [Coriobacteriia bacterium]|nr:iron export ABC transporter permease subunit FetB [Coriobacteriia bacterium]